MIGVLGYEVSVEISYIEEFRITSHADLLSSPPFIVLVQVAGCAVRSKNTRIHLSTEILGDFFLLCAIEGKKGDKVPLWYVRVLEMPLSLRPTRSITAIGRRSPFRVLVTCMYGCFSSAILMAARVPRISAENLGR